MNKYEVLFILEGALTEEAMSAEVEKFSALVTSLNGVVTTVDKWGLKQYAYPIDYKTEGYYVLMGFESDGSVPAELSRQMRNDENVVRSMITKK